MLLDRVSTHVLKDHDFGKLIGDDLAVFLESPDNKENLASSFSKTLQTIEPNWDVDRSRALVNMVKGWNNSPSYPKKIETTCNLLKIKGLSKSLLTTRHELLHGGKVKAEPDEALERYKEFNLHILVLLLRLLEYEGNFYSPGQSQECEMASFKASETNPS